MVAAPISTQIRPETRVFRVEELIAHARTGRIRVPTFQRGFKWEREDVQKLIDSIWRGYPIGSLLLWSKFAPAGRVTLGDLVFDVSEQTNAWFVVDGQQRIVSLVSTLLPGGGRGKQFDLCFDLETGTVVPPRRGGEPTTHLPLNRVADSEELLAWVDDHRTSLAPEQVRLAFRVGKALREYELPAQVVHTEDEAVVREIFLRMSSTGKALEASEVFGALRAPDAQPLDLKEVVEHLRARSLGELDEAWARRGLLAIERKAPTDEPQRQLEGLDIPAAVERISRALDRVFGFLAQDAGIPHLRLLPYQDVMVVLSAYFNRFPTPSARARRLLTRWLWRDAATGGEQQPTVHAAQQRAREARAALEAVHEGRSDEEAARGVLVTVPAQRPEEPAMTPSFNLKSARSRLSVIALIELRPHDLRSGAPLDVTGLLESRDDIALQIVTAYPSAIGFRDQGRAFSSVGNRLLHPAVGDVSMLPMLMTAIPQPPSSINSTHVLASHAISAEAVRALQANDGLRFVEIRRDEIEALTTRLIDRHAEWNHSDRPSIAALIDEED
ncbi:MAG TPA: DUF262 domain-containing protein [Kofleriaceae bacterium]|nr:DUF262 domain-containing protein [Kofleriaceae bacterium]